LVERLTRTEPEPETTRGHGALRGGRLRDDRWVIAERWTRDARPERHRLGRRAERRHPRPDEGVVSLLRYPRLEVIGRHHPPEAVGFREPGVFEELGWVKLL